MLDADGAGLEPAGEAVGHADVARPDAGGEAVFGLVAEPRQPVGVVLGRKARGHKHRAADLLAADLHAFLGVDQHGRLDEPRSEDHTYELQSLMRNSYADFL